MPRSWKMRAMTGMEYIAAIIGCILALAWWVIFGLLLLIRQKNATIASLQRRCERADREAKAARLAEGVRKEEGATAS